MGLLTFKTNEFRIIGRVVDVNLQYRTKSNKETVPVCEIEMEVSYNGGTDNIKVTAFYEKAEEIANEISVGEYILVKGRIRGQKGRYGEKNTYSMDLWLNSIEKAQEVEEGDKNGSAN